MGTTSQMDEVVPQPISIFLNETGNTRWIVESFLQNFTQIESRISDHSLSLIIEWHTEHQVHRVHARGVRLRRPFLVDRDSAHVPSYTWFHQS